MLISDLFLYGSNSRRFPTNHAQLKAFCKDVSTVIEVNVRPYIDRCFDRLAKRLANLILYSVTKNNSNTCRSRRRSAQFVEFGGCGNAGQRGTRRCWQRWLDGINGIKLLTDNKLVIPMGCCITYKMKDCFDGAYDRQGVNTCPQKSIDGLQRFFDGYITDSLSLMCGDYTYESDKCDKIVAKLPKVTASERIGSPVTLMITIYNKLSADELP